MTTLGDRDETKRGGEAAGAGRGAAAGSGRGEAGGAEPGETAGSRRGDAGGAWRGEAGREEAGRGEAGRAGVVSMVLGALLGIAASGSATAAVTLPAISAELGVARSSAVWTVTGYVLMLAVTTAVYGRLGDQFGLRRPLMAGVVLMASGAVAAALAPTFGTLLGARLLQGVGAAAVPVLAVAVISARYQGRVRAAALARCAGVAGMFGSLGPLAGGALEGVGGWRLALATPAVALLALPALARIAPGTGQGGRLDLPGAALVAAAAAGLVLLIQSPAAGLVAGGAGLTLLLVAAPLTVRHVVRRPEGFLPRTVATSPVVVRAAVAAGAIPAAWFGLLVAVPLVLAARGWSALATGLLLVPGAITGLLASRLSGRLLDRFGARRVLTAGAGTATGAMVVLLAGELLGAPAVLGLATALVTIAFGLAHPALITSVDAAVTEQRRGVALGVATLLFLLGGGVGSAIIGGVGDVLGITGGTLALAVVPLLGTVCAWSLPRDGGPVPARS